MSRFDEATLLAILDDAPKPRQKLFIETGTYKGQRARMVRPYFEFVHTIERNPFLWASSYNPLTLIGVVPHLGDSADLLPLLLDGMGHLNVFFFLDAHWGPKDGMDYGSRRLALWDELDAIAAHGGRNIVVVDDLRSFGTTNPTPEWLHVTSDAIAERLGAKSHYPINDQAVFLL